MKLSTREDIELPAEALFDELCDVSRFERAALKRGVSLKRLDTLSAPGAGMSWDIGFRFRGKPRQILADLRRFERPEALDYAGESSSFAMVLELRMVALSRSRTRLVAALEVKPRTLGARLMIQSAKLGRSNLERKFAERVKLFARALEMKGAAQG